MAVLKPSKPRIQWGHPLAQGLIAAYSFHERSGTGSSIKLDDLSGQTQSAITWATSAAAWTGGPGGSALDISTSNLKIALAYPFKTIAGATPCSIACRVFYKDDSSNGGTVTYSATSPGMMLQRFAGLMYWEINGPTLRVQDITGFTNSVWWDVLGTYDGSVLTLYRSGVQVGQRTRGAEVIETTDQFLYINQNGSGTTQNAIYDYVYVYNRCLSAYEAGMLCVDPYAAFRCRSVIRINPPAAPTIKFRRTLSQLGTRMGSRQRVLG